MATLELTGVSKRFGRDVWALRPTDLRAADQEFVVLLGPSGCGKSTTVRLIAGLEEPDSGRIRIGDRDVTDLPPRKRDVSMVFQSYAVWPHMTVFENVAFGLRLRKRRGDEIDRLVRETAELVKIGELLERYPAQLSGGQRQRVALARALAVEPKVFLMDEPLSNLDAKLRLQMRTELKAIHQQTRATTLFVTHDQAEALSMADRIVVMKDGEVVQVGSPEEVYTRCATAFVAGFIGSPPANFFEVEIRREAGRLTLVHPAFSWPVDESTTTALSSYDKLRLLVAVRPEDLALTTPERAVLSSRALVVEPQGAHQIVAVDVAGEIVKALAPNRPKVEAGEPVHLAFDAAHVQCFDPDDGRRVGER